MLRKFGFVLFGLLLIAPVVWLGLASTSAPVFVPWFGIASAILAPIGLAMIGMAFRSPNTDVLARLSKVPEIEKLISEAKTQEEKVRLLQEERSKLLETIKFETRRSALMARKESLETDAARVVEQLRATTEEIEKLDSSLTGSSVSHEVRELERMLEAKRQGAVIGFKIRGRYYTIDLRMFDYLPYSKILTEALTLVARFLK
jgi:Rad3-related DNA helicase